MKKIWKKCLLCIICALLIAMPLAELRSACMAEAAGGNSAKTSKTGSALSVQLRIGKTNVTKKTYTMKAGTTKTIKATASKKISSVTYKSSNTKVASVSKKGTVRAKKAGTAKITATVKTKQGSKSAWVKIRVRAAQQTPDPQPGPATDESSILIVYFTRSGNTEKIADIISEKTGGKKVRLETVKAYPQDYDSLLDIAMEEKTGNARPELKTKIAHMENYDTVFVGYPIWHGDVPMAVLTFLEEYDFTGKKVIPFCSSGSSSPDTSFAQVKESAKGAEVSRGFWTTSAGLGNLATTVPAWLDGLGMTWNEKKEGAEENTMKVTAGGTTFTAALADNSSVTALKELLKKGPLTIRMSDYASMEKVGPIGTHLPQNDEQITTGAGDIILYQGDSLVIYYDTNSWNFTRIGKIEGVTKEELLKALGTGDVTVTFSLQQG